MHSILLMLFKGIATNIIVGKITRRFTHYQERQPEDVRQGLLVLLSLFHFPFGYFFYEPYFIWTACYFWAVGVLGLVFWQINWHICPEQMKRFRRFMSRIKGSDELWDCPICGYRIIPETMECMNCSLSIDILKKISKYKF